VRERRRRVVSAGDGAFRTRTNWRYAEIRPIPYQVFNQLLDGHGGIITTDCSGLATCCYKRAGVADPHGLNYNGQGFTGDMLVHLPHIPLNRAQPGDLAVFGDGNGKHVVVLLEAPSAANGMNPSCVSHGKPGDPHIASLATFEGLGVLTVLRAMPRGHQIIRKKLQAKWRVIGDAEKVIGHVYTTRWLWWARHRRIVKRQRENLRFERIHH